MLTKTNPPPQFAFINISSCSPILFRQKALVIQNYFCIFTPNMQIMDNLEVIYYFIHGLVGGCMLVMGQLSVVCCLRNLVDLLTR